MDTATLDPYKGIPMFLVLEGNEYSLAFGSPDNHPYWLEGLNKVLETSPEHVFQVKLADNKFELINMKEFSPYLSQVNELVNIIK